MQQNKDEGSVTLIRGLNERAAHLIARSKQCQTELNAEHAKEFNIDPTEAGIDQLKQAIIRVKIITLLFR